MAKIKENLKSSKGKAATMYKEIPIRPLLNFAAKTFQARRECHDIFKVMKGKTYNQEYSTWQNTHLYLKRDRVLKTSKSKKSSAPLNWLYKNAKGTLLSGKDHN